MNNIDLTSIFHWKLLVYWEDFFLVHINNCQYTGIIVLLWNAFLPFDHYRNNVIIHFGSTVKYYQRLVLVHWVIKNNYLAEFVIYLDYKCIIAKYRLELILY